MQPADNPAPSQREACLPWMLGFFFVGFGVLMLTVATGGFFVYILGVAGAVALVAGMHYALWGQRLDDKVVGEREAAEARDDALADEKWNEKKGDDRFQRRSDVK